MIPLDHSLRHSLPPEALRAIDLILAERRAQDAKWGVQNHDPITWMAILTEEVGESSREALEMQFSVTDEEIASAVERFRAEVVQCAAVCHAIIECLARRERAS